jgi:hypothetical protein
MLKLNNLLVALLLITGAVYGGLKGYIHYKFKNAVDDIVAIAKPFARIDYGGLGSSFDGTLTVEDIAISPWAFDDEVQMQVVEIQGPGLGFLLSGAKQFERGEMPEKMRFAMKGVRLDVDGELLGALRDAQSSDWALMMGIQDSSACGLEQIFGPWNMRELGYDGLVVDVGADFNFNKAINELRMALDYSARGIESTSVNMTLSGMKPLAAIRTRVQPQLDDFMVKYSMEPSYASKAIEYCAEANKKTVDEFIQWMVSEDNEYYTHTLGIVPGPGIRGALERFLKNPDEIHISAQPPTALDPSGLQFYTPEDIIELLGLQVFVNNEPVQDLSFQVADTSRFKRKRKPMTKSLESAKATTRMPGDVRRSAVTPARAKTSSTQGTESYRRVKTRALRDYVGKRVRLHTTSGMRRDGWLTEIRNGQAVIVPDKYGGGVSIHVPLSRINKAEVFVAGES